METLQNRSDRSSQVPRAAGDRYFRHIRSLRTCTSLHLRGGCYFKAISSKMAVKSTKSALGNARKTANFAEVLGFPRIPQPRMNTCVRSCQGSGSVGQCYFRPSRFPVRSRRVPAGGSFWSVNSAFSPVQALNVRPVHRADLAEPVRSFDPSAQRCRKPVLPAYRFPAHVHGARILWRFRRKWL